MSSSGRSDIPVVLVNSFADEREMYATYLRQCGFAVLPCDTPTAALRVTRQRPVAAVVTRIVQPGALWDGIELTRRIKGAERTKHVPVVIITSRIEPALWAAAKQAGCDGLLMLPSSPQQVASELRRLMAISDSSSEGKPPPPALSEE